MIKEIVERVYRETVEQSLIPAGLRESLPRSEISKKFREVLVVNLIQANRVRANRGKPIFTRKAVEGVVRDLTIAHLQLIQHKAEERILSDAEKYRIKHQDDQVKDMEATLEGKKSGDFEDIDFEIDDSREKLIDPDYQTAEDKDPIEKPDRIITHG